MRSDAVIFERPGRLTVGPVDLKEPTPADVIVTAAVSGISTGTERLLWQGSMPVFPGMGYPLVPGYETIGEIVEAGAESGRRVGERVFVPGSSGYATVRGLFGATARTLVVPGARVVPAPVHDERGVLLALAATAFHAISGGLPDLIVGHGTLGRLIARITVALGGTPMVWEKQAARRGGGAGYSVVDPAVDDSRDHTRILDASGAADILDLLIPRLARGEEIVLAGFYADRVGFAFSPAFMREARLRIAAEWAPADMAAVLKLIEGEKLSLEGLVTHRSAASAAAEAYERAFTDPDCLKMTLDWSH